LHEKNTNAEYAEKRRLQMRKIELTLELAREIELAEAEAALGCVRTMKALEAATLVKPIGAGSGIAERSGSATSHTLRARGGPHKEEERLAAERIGGGWAVYCGSGNPVTQAVGVGLSGAVSKQEFDRLEEFYFSRGEPVRVETCPLADASLLAHYRERGYHVTEFSNVMVRPVIGVDSPLPRASGDVEIRLAEREEIELWVLTVAQGFAEQYPVTEEILRVMKLFALGEKTECYLAMIGDKVAGGGTLAVRGRIAGLFGASTLPEFRKRGVQSALLARRMERAAQVGCELAMSLAQPGSVSARNIGRCGFEALYTRVKFEREVAAPRA
jgi:GNAT superfamily N-acetyltransferase